MGVSAKGSYFGMGDNDPKNTAIILAIVLTLYIAIMLKFMFS